MLHELDSIKSCDSLKDRPCTAHAKARAVSVALADSLRERPCATAHAEVRALLVAAAGGAGGDSKPGDSLPLARAAFLRRRALALFESGWSAAGLIGESGGSEPPAMHPLSRCIVTACVGGWMRAHANVSAMTVAS